MLFSVVALVLLGYGGFSLLAANRYLYPPRRVPTLPETLVAAELVGTPVWVSPSWQTSQTVIILAHGYGGTRKAWAEIAPALSDQGYGVIAPAMPGQDESPQRIVGFGPAESALLTELSRIVRRENPSARLVLMGISLGAAACWDASLTIQPDAVIAESAFAVLSEGIRGYVNAVVPGGELILKGAIAVARRRSGVNPSEIRPIHAAEKWKGPALILAASEDTLSPLQVLDSYQEAVPHAEIAIFSGAKHAKCYESDPNRYLSVVSNFLSRLSQDGSGKLSG